MFITGPAGSGKTVLLNHLISTSGTDGVFCTALTGMAAQAIGGTTLHKYAGVGLAQLDAPALLKKLTAKAKYSWRNTKTLFIDEVSMLDAELFEKLDYIARGVRHRPGELWGGIQLVMVSVCLLAS